MNYINRVQTLKLVRVKTEITRYISYDLRTSDLISIETYCQNKKNIFTPFALFYTYLYVCIMSDEYRYCKYYVT